MRKSDFTSKTRKLLAERAGNVCSVPDCVAPTSGPQLDPRKAIRAGDAAHITAASPNGPRYDSSLTPAQRRSYDNGIWLCVNHARIVDQDVSRYSTELLRLWKAQAEEKARSNLGRPHAIKSQSSAVVRSFARNARLIIAALSRYKRKDFPTGLKGPLAGIAQDAATLGIPVPIEVVTVPYPDGVEPSNPLLADCFESTMVIRFPDGSQIEGKCAHTFGWEQLIEDRESAIVALEQWLVHLDHIPAQPDQLGAK